MVSPSIPDIESLRIPTILFLKPEYEKGEPPPTHQFYAPTKNESSKMSCCTRNQCILRPLQDFSPKFRETIIFQLVLGGI